MTITLDANVLLAYYQAREGGTSTGTTASGGSAASKVPMAPWNAASTSTPSKSPSSGAAAASSTAAPAISYASVNSLVQSLIGGTQIINPASAKLSVSTSSANANSDYKNLFARYQGLTSLQSLANAAGSSATTTANLAQLQKAFTAGLGQVQSFLSSGPFKEFQVGDGTVTASDQTTAGAPEETDTYVTGLTTTSAGDVLPSLQGEAQFSVSVAKFNGPTTVVNFNLADLGATPRTLNTVVAYMNDQLKAAGVATRFGEDVISSGTQAAAAKPASGLTPATPATSATAPEIALEVKGSALETLTFSAPTTAPSVYVGQTSTAPTVGGTTTSATTATSSASTAAPPASASQLIDFDPTGQNATTSQDKVWSDSLPAGATVQSTATASDGSVYVLANVTQTTSGQAIQGTQDAALLKYDSAGNLVYTRTLGAATSASGLALAVSADGSQVAVAGSVSGTLDPTDTADLASPTSQSFVSVYTASTGDELWSGGQQAAQGNQVDGVAFGADNTVYVAGTTDARLPGATAAGGQDAYLQAFSAKVVHDPKTYDASWQVTPGPVQEFGTSGVDRATGIAVDGSSLYVSSVENGDAVVRAYSTAAAGAPTLTAKQDLGALDGGNLSGIALSADGSVYVAGSTHDGALNAGTVTAAYTSGEDGFVAHLSASLDPASPESIAYLSDGHDTTATALAVSGGQVYVAGQNATGASALTGAISQAGYVEQVDPGAGQVGWSQAFQGVDGNAAPASVAVDASGSSALDALGLPTGTIDYTPSNTIVANTSLRVGDSFGVQVGSGAPVAVTIGATDTYSSLAQKIERASNFEVSATTTTDSQGNQEIKIAPATRTTSTQVSIQAGPVGRNALAGLGLQAGLITNASSNQSATVSGAKAANNLKAAYTVNAPTTLSLATPAGVAASQKQISTAIAEVQSIYSDLTSSNTSASGSGAGGNSTLVNYYNSQAANYATALQRLTASAGRTTPTTSLL